MGLAIAAKNQRTKTRRKTTKTPKPQNWSVPQLTLKTKQLGDKVTTNMGIPVHLGIMAN